MENTSNNNSENGCNLIILDFFICVIYVIYFLSAKWDFPLLLSILFGCISGILLIFLFSIQYIGVFCQLIASILWGVLFSALISAIFTPTTITEIIVTLLSIIFFIIMHLGSFIEIFGDFPFFQIEWKHKDRNNGNYIIYNSSSKDKLYILFIFDIFAFFILLVIRSTQSSFISSPLFYLLGCIIYGIIICLYLKFQLSYLEVCFQIFFGIVWGLLIQYCLSKLNLCYIDLSITIGCCIILHTILFYISKTVKSKLQQKKQSKKNYLFILEKYTKISNKNDYLVLSADKLINDKIISNTTTYNEYKNNYELIFSKFRKELSNMQENMYLTENKSYFFMCFSTLQALEELQSKFSKHIDYFYKIINHSPHLIKQSHDIIYLLERLSNEHKKLISKANNIIDCAHDEPTLTNALKDFHYIFLKYEQQANNMFSTIKKNISYIELYYQKEIEQAIMLLNKLINLQKDFNNHILVAYNLYYVYTEEYSKTNQKATESHNNNNDNLDISLFNGCTDIETLRKRYKNLLKIYHPDNQSGDNDMTIKIENTYEYLSNQYS